MIKTLLQKKKFFSGAGDTGQRAWENFYRNRWQHDKEVRSTHGVNCTGSCSWKIFVKKGIVTWEIQQTDYPQNRPGLPNHEPRGCPRGASYSWYLYNSGRVKHPMIRHELLEAYQQQKAILHDPVPAWEAVMADEVASKKYKERRGLGGFVRLDWNLAQEIIAAANIYTIKKYGPDRLVGFTPIPAFSMVSYAAGTRYLSLIGGTCLSFYDFYCDLPPASPQTWGEQTDVPESADWYNSSFIMLWGSNVPVTRTPDSPFLISYFTNLFQNCQIMTQGIHRKAFVLQNEILKITNKLLVQLPKSKIFGFEFLFYKFAQITPRIYPFGLSSR